MKNRNVNVSGSPHGQSPKRGVKRKNPGRNRRPVAVKYGIKIPRTVKEAYAFDAAEGHNLWAEAITAEIESLFKLECFEFHDPGV